MGTAILVGSMIPIHFKNHPIQSGNSTIDSIFNMLFSIQMLIGGLTAFVLDNTVPGEYFIFEKNRIYEKGFHFDLHYI